MENVTRLIIFHRVWMAPLSEMGFCILVWSIIIYAPLIGSTTRVILVGGNNSVFDRSFERHGCRLFHHCGCDNSQEVVECISIFFQLGMSFVPQF